MGSHIACAHKGTAVTRAERQLFGLLLIVNVKLLPGRWELVLYTVYDTQGMFTKIYLAVTRITVLLSLSLFFPHTPLCHPPPAPPRKKA